MQGGRVGKDFPVRLLNDHGRDRLDLPGQKGKKLQTLDPSTLWKGEQKWGLRGLVGHFLEREYIERGSRISVATWSHKERREGAAQALYRRGKKHTGRKRRERRRRAANRREALLRRARVNKKIIAKKGEIEANEGSNSDTRSGRSTQS